jgi:hypothetical protein
MRAPKNERRMEEETNKFTIQIILCNLIMGFILILHKMFILNPSTSQMSVRRVVLGKKSKK